MPACFNGKRRWYLEQEYYLTFFCQESLHMTIKFRVSEFLYPSCYAYIHKNSVALQCLIKCCKSYLFNFNCPEYLGLIFKNSFFAKAVSNEVIDTEYAPLLIQLNYCQDAVINHVKFCLICERFSNKNFWRHFLLENSNPHFAWIVIAKEHECWLCIQCTFQLS